jgi:type II secretory pathway component PulC
MTKGIVTKRSAGERAMSTLRFFQIFLLALILLTLIYSLVTFFNKNYFFEKRLPQVSLEAADGDSPDDAAKKDYVSFLKDIGSRDIFTPAYALDAGSSDDEEFARIMERLTLVGVIAGPPKKAIVEDRQTNRTFYLREGEIFLENIGVEQIDKDSVIFNMKGRGFELYL